MRDMYRENNSNFNCFVSVIMHVIRSSKWVECKGVVGLRENAWCGGGTRGLGEGVGENEVGL